MHRPFISASIVATCLLGTLAGSAVAVEPEFDRIDAPVADGLHRFSNKLAVGTNYALASARVSVETEAVYVIDLKTNSVVRRLEIPDSLEEDEIYAIDMDGDVAVVGIQNWYSRRRAGRAYMFDLQADTVRELRAPLLSDQPAFGSSAAIDGQYIVVGSMNETVRGVWRSGVVHLFDRASGDYIRTLRPDRQTEYGNFGSSVDVSEGRVIVGAPRFDADGVPSRGTAFLFDASNGVQIAELGPAAFVDGSLYGFRVAIGSGVAAVAEPFSYSGKVHVFGAEDGESLYQRVSFDPTHLQYFGWGLAISEGRLHVGATGDRRGGLIRSGAVTSYDARTGSPVGEFLPSDAGGWLGDNLVQRNGVIYSSAHEWQDPADGASGSIYLFDASRPVCYADVTADGIVDQSDLSSFLFAFQFDLREADIAEPYGVHNFWDLDRFLQSWRAGCYE